MKIEGPLSNLMFLTLIQAEPTEAIFWIENHGGDAVRAFGDHAERYLKRIEKEKKNGDTGKTI